LRTFGLRLPDWNAGLQKSVQVLVAGLEDMSAAKPGG
jgi:hypothetical protein